MHRDTTSNASGYVSHENDSRNYINIEIYSGCHEMLLSAQISTQRMAFSLLLSVATHIQSLDCSLPSLSFAMHLLSSSTLFRLNFRAHFLQFNYMHVYLTTEIMDFANGKYVFDGYRIYFQLITFKHLENSLRKSSCSCWKLCNAMQT